MARKLAHDTAARREVPLRFARRIAGKMGRAVAPLSLLALLGGGCSTPAPTASPATSSSAAGEGSAPSVVASATFEPSAAVPDPGPALGGAATADGSSPGWPASAPVAGLERLPKGGAFYAALRLPFVDLLVSLMPAGDRHELLRELERTVPRIAEGPAEAIARHYGLDPSRSLLVTALAPSLEPVRTAMSRITSAATDAGYQAATKQAAGHAVHYRLVLPIQATGDARKVIRLVAEQLLQGGPVESCPEAKGCAAFGALGPSVIGQGQRGALAAYASSTEVEIDLAMPLFVEGRSPGIWSVLAAMRKVPLGGPQGSRCKALDGAAHASACIDADAMAELSVVTAYGLVARAVGGENVEPSVRRTIAEQGRKEAEQSLRLAQPTRRLLDDGSLSVQGAAGHVRFRGSWALTKESQASVTAAWPAERCVARAGSEARVLLAALRDALGSAGPDFVDPKARLRDVQEAGWGAWPVLFARTWPNFLGLDELLTPNRELSKELDRARLCLSVENERLVIETELAQGG